MSEQEGEQKIYRYFIKEDWIKVRFYFVIYGNSLNILV